MNTLELDLTHPEAFDDSEIKKLSEGDTLVIKDDSGNSQALFTALILVAGILLLAFLANNKKRKGDSFGEEVEKKYFSGKSSEELEKEIEEKFGVHINVVKSQDNFKLSSLRGKIDFGFKSEKEIDSYLHNLREEWN